MKLPLQLDDSERQALSRLAVSQDGILVLSWLERNAKAFLASSMRTDNDAASRQAQGAYVALDDFVTRAAAATK